MMDWYNSLEPALKIYWGIAIIASVIFAVQTLISLIGGTVFDNADMDVNADVDTSMDSDGSHGSGVSHFFSVRNLINFLLGVGWGGVCFYHTISSEALLMFVAVVCGIIFVLIFFSLVKILLKLSKDNTFQLSETLDKTADVYLFIPGNELGKGKIQISVRGSVHELDALTTGEKIPTGAKVRVIKIFDSQAVLVEKI
jgi:hypothetical protein